MGGTLSLRKCQERRGTCNTMEADNNGALNLSAKEKAALRRTWTVMKDNEVNRSVQVFLRIFKLAPKCRELFPFGMYDDDDKLAQNVIFKAHATRFIRSVALTLDNLDALEIIVMPSLVRLGRKHADINRFQTEYFEVFVQAMMDVWSWELSNKIFSGEVRTAWYKTFLFIMDKVRQGYTEAMSEKSAKILIDQGELAGCGNSGAASGQISMVKCHNKPSPVLTASQASSPNRANVVPPSATAVHQDAIAITNCSSTNVQGDMSSNCSRRIMDADATEQSLAANKPSDAAI